MGFGKRGVSTVPISGCCNPLGQGQSNVKPVLPQTRSTAAQCGRKLVKWCVVGCLELIMSHTSAQSCNSEELEPTTIEK
eukprot:1978609-Amphidinium_carterae.3